jgi:hypothetical protein
LALCNINCEEEVVILGMATGKIAQVAERALEGIATMVIGGGGNSLKTRHGTRRIERGTS